METWKYLEDPQARQGGVDLAYWYAFAGDPAASLAGGSAVAWQPDAHFPDDGASTVLAIAYDESPGHEGQATVVLAAELIGRLPAGTAAVEICATRCAQ